MVPAPPRTAEGQSAQPQASPKTTGELLLWHLEHLLPSFLTDLSRAGSNSSLPTVDVQQFFLFLKSALTEAQPMLLILSALASSPFGAS